jgi:hypothetical protein
MGKGKMIEDGRERRGRKNRKVILRPLQAWKYLIREDKKISKADKSNQQ